MHNITSSDIAHFEEVQLSFEDKLKQYSNEFSPIGRIENFLDTNLFNEPKYVFKIPMFNNEDTFIVHRSTDNQLVSLWSKYIIRYIEILSHTRNALRNELLDDNHKIRVDTENKQIIFLQHPNLNIKKGVLEISCQSDKILSRTDNERRIRV